MESILKTLNLKKKEEESPKFNLLFTKKQGGRGQSEKNKNTVSIGKKNIVIREKIIDRLELDNNCSCSVGAIDNKICLIISRKKEDDLVSMYYSSTKNEAKKKKTMYANIPKMNEEMMENFRGTYEMENVRDIDKYIVFDLIKIKK